MLPGRYLERPQWDEILGLAVKAGLAGHTLVTGMHRAIAALSRAGCDVVADHVLVEPQWLGDCTRLFAGLPAYLIGVYCPLDVLEQRERARQNRTLGQARAQYDIVHANKVYDLFVDTSIFSSENRTWQIRQRVQNGIQPDASIKMAERQP